MPVWTTTHLSLSAERLPWRGRWPRAGSAMPQALEEAGRLFAPQAVYEIVPLRERTAVGPLLEGGLLLHSLDLLASLGPADCLALAVYTIGPALEARSRTYGEQGEIMGSFLLDALGTAALDELERALRRHLGDELAPRGLCLGTPLSPGQLDWPLQDQPALFGFLHPGRIGVRLNEQGMMVPLKSVSCAIPIGREGELPAALPACARCPRRSGCPYSEASAAAE